MLPLEACLSTLPVATDIIFADREEELDVETIVPVTDNELADVAEKVKQRQAEISSPGWQ